MNIDKSQIRNVRQGIYNINIFKKLIISPFQYRDFLQLYNKLTELCFTQCVDNLFSRNLSNEEVSNSLTYSVFDLMILPFVDIMPRELYIKIYEC